MGRAKARDEAASLRDLSPMELYPFAIFIPEFHPYGRPHYKQPFRRYKTLSHAKTGANGLPGRDKIVFYAFNFSSDTWEVIDETS